MRRPPSGPTAYGSSEIAARIREARSWASFRWQSRETTRNSTAPADEPVGPAEQGDQAAGGLLEHGVAAGVPEEVVHGLEAIQVEQEEQRSRLGSPVSRRSSKRRFRRRSSLSTTSEK